MRLAICGQFFLDPASWEQLRVNVIPDLLRTRKTLRVWSVGCHNGKEPYSVAILLEEITPGQQHEIIATDRDAEVLANAKLGGPFTALDLNNMTQVQISMFFEPGGPPYFVNHILRSRVTFCQHDVLEDVVDCNLDIILYRNIEPFFSPEVNRQMYRRFHDILRPGGVVFTGAVERIADALELGYERIGDCLYRKAPYS
jgi:chemotaxis protein methyltransferase CheR